MWRALEHAMTFVGHDGLLAIALYRRSPACSLWRREKSFYSRAPQLAHTIVRLIYKATFLGAIAASGRNPLAYLPPAKASSARREAPSNSSDHGD
jgi:hypothetical protein